MTQEKQILNHLQSGKTITPLEALRLFGCFRLAARIFNLRKKGYTIKTNYVTRKNKTFAKYELN